MSANESQQAPLVTILVPCYNYGRYLGDCLGSIFAQTLIDKISVEVIVINDASTDDTEHVMRGFTDPRIRYVQHEQNKGIIYTLSEGLTLARGMYFARIDADDRWRRHFLETTLPILEMYPEVGVVYGDVIHIDEHNNISEDPRCLISAVRHNHKDTKGNELLEQLNECTIGTAGVIGRTHAWRNGLPFPSWFTWQSPSDWYLNNMAMVESETYYVNDILGEYRRHGLNLTSNDRTPPVSIEETLIGMTDKVMSDTRLNISTEQRYEVYANTWLKIADVYFEKGVFSQARRCYINALRYKPEFVLRNSIARHLATTFVPRTWYVKLKNKIKEV